MPRPPRRRRPWWARLRRNPVLWWVAAVALALATGTVVDRSLVRAADAARRFGDLRPVPVLTRDVAPGEVLDAGAVRMEERPAAFVPGAAPAGAAEGRVALDHLVAGEVLVESRVAPNGLRGPAALLPPGSRALSVPGGPAGRPPVAVGDLVDVLATAADGAWPTVVVARGARVVAVDPEADTVTVAVPAAEALQVATALAGGVVTLALAGASQDGRATTTARTASPATTR